MTVQQRSEPPGWRDDRPTVLIRRLRKALWCWLATLIFFAIVDLYIAAPYKLSALFAIKLASAAATVAALFALRTVRRWRTLIAIALLIAATSFVLCSASAIIDGEDRTLAILSLAVAMATATMLPWGARPQAVVAVIALVSAGICNYAVHGGVRYLVTYPNVGLVIGLIISVWTAHQFERSRRVMARRERQQWRAEEALRRLNEVLEERVAERTGELERANQARREEIAVRSAAELQLRRSQAALSALIENAPDAVWSVDRANRVTAFNSVVGEHFAALYNMSLRVGANYGNRTIADLQEYWVPMYERSLAGERFSVEHAFELGDGMHYFRTRFNPIVTAGAVTGVAVFSADITEGRRAAESARVHHAELTHVLRLSSMGEMASGLAHEIKQPLTAIVNYARGCARRLRTDHPDVEAVLPVLDDIANEALRAGEIIRRLRSLVRKEAPRQDWLDLADVATHVLGFVEPDMAQNGIAVSVDVEPGLPRVLADRIQIEQVVLNLLRNAIDAMADADGRRELRVRITTIGGDAVELAVRDTGKGMSPVVAEHVFEPFFSTKPDGLGMGLSISRNIIEVHHGRLSVSPNSDCGVTFRVNLPVPPVPPPLIAAAG